MRGRSGDGNGSAGGDAARSGASGAKLGKRLTLLLASSVIVLAASDVSLAQTPKPAVATSQKFAFSIPAQPLPAAIKAFIRATGWQVGYPAALLQNKSSKGISGQMSPEAALRTMLVGSGISLRITGPETATLVDEAAAAAIDGGDSTVLGTIVVDGANKGVYLGTDSVADTGTTTISAGQIVARSAGNDANDILRNLPNVQYQNDIDEDAGVSDQDVIDLKPREVSIAGARVYENNFILEGMPINTVTGTEEAYGVGGTHDLDDLTKMGAAPTQERMYGLHSQSVYVPTDFLESTTVIDSNASAAYGNFQGVWFPTRCGRPLPIDGTVALVPISAPAAGPGIILRQKPALTRMASRPQSISNAVLRFPSADRLLITLQSSVNTVGKAPPLKKTRTTNT